MRAPSWDADLLCVWVPYTCGSRYVFVSRLRPQMFVNKLSHVPEKLKECLLEWALGLSRGLAECLKGVTTELL